MTAIIAAGHGGVSETKGAGKAQDPSADAVSTAAPVEAEPTVEAVCDVADQHGQVAELVERLRSGLQRLVAPSVGELIKRSMEPTDLYPAASKPQVTQAQAEQGLHRVQGQIGDRIGELDRMWVETKPRERARSFEAISQSARLTPAQQRLVGQIVRLQDEIEYVARCRAATIRGQATEGGEKLDFSTLGADPEKLVGVSWAQTKEEILSRRAKQKELLAEAEKFLTKDETLKVELYAAGEQHIDKEGYQERKSRSCTLSDLRKLEADLTLFLRMGFDALSAEGKRAEEEARSERQNDDAEQASVERAHELRRLNQASLRAESARDEAGTQHDLTSRLRASDELELLDEGPARKADPLAEQIRLGRLGQGFAG